MSTSQLRLLVRQEARRLSETLEQGKGEAEDVNAKEVEADDLANVLEKDLDHMKALKIKEVRLKRNLKKIVEAKKSIRTRIMKRLR
tara:strand:- start:295 stop:552 length:258 start_codon:yes stop_codon:yes gene_type:complete